MAVEAPSIIATCSKYIYSIEQAKKGLIHVSESLPIDPIDAISPLQFALFNNGTSILFNSIFARRGLSFPYFFFPL